MAGNRRWTSEEDKLLRELCRGGDRWSDIAEEIDRTPQAVQSRATALGVRSSQRGRPRIVEDRLQIIELIGLGLRSKQIAAIVGKHHTVVHKVIMQLCREGVLARIGGATKNCRYEVSRWWRWSATMSANGQKKWDNVGEDDGSGEQAPPPLKQTG